MPINTVSDRGHLRSPGKHPLHGFRAVVDLGCIDLNAHTVWALLASRRGLLTADPHLNRLLVDRVAVLLDSSAISSQTRRELESVHYGLTLHI
ncbi:hypothetical protein ACFW5D_11515 [Streptomyces sp. NPDC058770]|uniref:hypothetical protein n=1 Tax=unclassified Streptomyces TaxID=2593676 RepID=UPI003693996C